MKYQFTNKVKTDKGELDFDLLELAGFEVFDQEEEGGISIIKRFENGAIYGFCSPNATDCSLDFDCTAIPQGATIDQIKAYISQGLDTCMSAICFLSELLKENIIEEIK